MPTTIENSLRQLADTGNLRRIPAADLPDGIIDLSSNDYLGLAAREDLRREFLDSAGCALPFTAAASRLLASVQSPFTGLERTISEAYGNGRGALLFNSGYHANTGLIAPLCDRDTVIVADKLVHASIIDGMKLSGAPFERFRHNDTAHLARILAKIREQGRRPLIIVESVYSMDGDRAPLEEISRLKSELAPESLLYVDEAHAVGVEGPSGLGLAKDIPGVDIIVGTFGKALASAGAFAVMSPTLREWMVNKCRSLIFSTALPPFQIAWTEWIFKRAMDMNAERAHLKELCAMLADILHRHGAPDATPGHIRPLLTGDPRKAVELSSALAEEGFNVLPIRTPTVPPGTDRLRFSLSASITKDQLMALDRALDRIL